MTPNQPIAQSSALRCAGRALSWAEGPLIMGILNVSEDSFFDGGAYRSLEAALGQAEKMVREGAAVIDVGGQSTRPGFTEISAEEEIARVVPVIEAVVKRFPVTVSVDTYKPAVARAALRAGAHVLNDITGFQGDPELPAVAAASHCGVMLMHREPAFKEAKGDVIARVGEYFERSLQIAGAAGIAREYLVLDPGIGFFKTAEQSLELMARIGELRRWGLPLLLGASRKSSIGHVLDLPVEERLEGTLATTVLAVWQGVAFIRVHDVQANVRAARMAWALAQRKSLP